MIDMSALRGFLPTIIGLSVAAVRASLLARVWTLLAIGILFDTFLMQLLGIDRHQIALAWSEKYIKYLPAMFHEFVDKAWIGPLGIMAPVFKIFEANTIAEFSVGFIASLFTVLIWGVIGSAICRIALCRMANRPIPRCREAVRFAIKHIVSVFGPVLTLFGMASVITITLWLLGRVHAIPVIGPAIAWITIPLAIVPTIFAVVMFVGLAFGWPLILGAAMAEAEDSFESLSRSQTYLFQAPVSLAVSIKVGIIVQAASWIFVQFMVWASIALLSISLKSSPTAVPDWDKALPSPWSLPQLHSDALASWISIIQSIVANWPIGFEFSFAGVLYLVLRLRVDGTNPTEIYMPETQCTQESSHDAKLF